MTFPHCSSARIAARKRRTSLGYRTFACHDCRRSCNERTAGSFNHLQYPTDVVTMAVLWRVRYKLSLRDVAELLLQRSFDVTHETIRAWEFRFAPLVAERLRARRRGWRSASWCLDETYVKVAGRWCYLYRANDRDGNLLDSINYTEQSQRGLKQRSYPMLGFGSFESASRYCEGFDELRDSSVSNAAASRMSRSLVSAASSSTDRGHRWASGVRDECGRLRGRRSAWRGGRCEARICIPE